MNTPTIFKLDSQEQLPEVARAASPGTLVVFSDGETAVTGVVDEHNDLQFALPGIAPPGQLTLGI